jgi:hypothetical protein
VAVALLLLIQEDKLAIVEGLEPLVPAHVLQPVVIIAAEGEADLVALRRDAGCNPALRHGVNRKGSDENSDVRSEVVSQLQ